MNSDEIKIRDDRTIRANVLVSLEKFSWVSGNLINVVVLDEVVQLWGVITEESQRKNILGAAERTVGVIAVEDHLMLVQPTAFAALMP